MRKERHPWVLLLVFALSGCATATIHSKLEQATPPRLSRVDLVGLPIGDVKEDYSLQQLLLALADKLARRSVAVAIRPAAPPLNGVLAPAPDAVMLVRFATSEIVIGSAGMGGVAVERATTGRGDVQIQRPDPELILWSATFDFGYPGGRPGDVVDACAEKILGQMTEDGLVARKP
jgi:hypothetical protein